MFDISVFSNIELSQSVVKVSRGDLSALKILYDNSIRMGSGNDNIRATASIHPDVWLPQMVDIILDSVAYITKLPQFSMVSYRDNKIRSEKFEVGEMFFTNDDSLSRYISSNAKFGEIVLFSMVKYINIQNMDIRWEVRCIDTMFKVEKRDKKIDFVTDK